MNLNISYNWLKEYVKTKDTAQEFARQISLCGPSVDSVTEIKPNFSKAVVGQIVKIEKHLNADKLQVCQVDVGEKEPLSIVCGASNIEEGQKVPTILVGGKVGDFEIKKAKIRGVESSGMMCSQKELGLGDDNLGIYILPEYTEIGLPLEKAMPINDSVFDMEVTSNRPDAMSIVGIAREAAAILDLKFLYQSAKPNLDIADSKKLTVNNKENELCRRYQAVVMSGVKVGASPLWMQRRLLSAGLRPINNLVDITNYILLEYGQPMHVFDYDKLAGQEINIRMAKKGEKISALDGKIYELQNTSLVIADSKSPVAIAGVMGGELSAATSETKTIVFESANFDSVSVRKTARLLNLHSESSDLFEKSLPPEGTEPALLKAIELAIEIAGAKSASKIFDVSSHKNKELAIELDPAQVNRILGVEIKNNKIKSILQSLGFKVSNSNKELSVVVPWWRQKDIEGEHDLIEEVARIYGYHKLPSVMLTGKLPDPVDNSEFYWEDKAKDLMFALGFSEVYNYSFASEKAIKDCSLDLDKHIRISNPLSADFEYMRTSLVPGILQNIGDNQSSYKDFKIFELGRVFFENKGDLADENSHLCFASVSQSGADSFFELKGAIESLLSRLNISEFRLVELKSGENIWDKNRSASIVVGDDNKIIGRVGFISREVLYLFSIKTEVCVAEIDFELLKENAKTSSSFKEIPKYPAIELDISMEINESIKYGEIGEVIKNVSPLIEDVCFLSVYQGEEISAGQKALAVRVIYRNNDKTLELSEAQKVHQEVVSVLKKKYNIKVR